eukprot:3870790-Prymnesium_polylepis.2
MRPSRCGSRVPLDIDQCPQGAPWCIHDVAAAPAAARSSNSARQAELTDMSAYGMERQRVQERRIESKEGPFIGSTQNALGFGLVLPVSPCPVLPSRPSSSTND